MLKKLIPIVFALMLAISMLSGCTAQQPAVTEEPAAAATTENATEPAAEEAEPVHLVLTTWDSGSAIDILQSMLDEFYETHPNITVEIQSIVQGYDEKVQIFNASGETPDVLLMWNTPQYVESGIVANLDDFIAADNFDMSMYYPVTTLWAEYKGHVYGLPKDVTPRAIFYNKNVFDAAGIAYPQDGWTWDEFTATVQALTNGQKGADAQYGFIALSSQTYMLQGYIWSNGGQIISDDGMTATGYVNSPAVAETIAWYKEVFDSSARSLVATGEGNPGNAEFMTGKVAMMDNGCWPIADLRADESLQWGVVTPPVPTAGAAYTPVVHSATWSVYDKSAHKAEAWELVKFLGGKEGAKYGGNAGYSPTAIPSLNKELGLENTDLSMFLTILDMPTLAPEFVKSPRYWEADSVFQAACEKIFLGDEDIQTTLDAAASEMDTILQKPIGE